MMFAIPRHNSLQVYDSAHDAVSYDSTDLMVYQIQDLQIDTLVIGPKGGILTICPDGKNMISGEVKLCGRQHRPAIFEVSGHKHSPITIVLPKMAIAPWQHLYSSLNIGVEWFTSWNSTRFSIRPKSKKSTLIEIGARFYFPARSQQLTLDSMALPFDIQALQD